ncbi:pilus assembly protein [Dyella humicola]|uniref:pilus assembly protein n=1 Tax=Dyella humicola TaxID=2992126 RepID=UPI00225413A3|nr:PilC/PilY family type IV pilus protein [Dyella humicola]
MSTRPSSQRLRLGISAVLLTLISGFAAPFTPVAQAATASLGTTELSPTPPNQTQAVAPNIVMTFDDSGSMQSNRLNDAPPFTTNNSGGLLNSAWDWSGGPWRCAGLIDADHATGSNAALRGLTMNGVYYNPNISYKTPMYTDGTSFANADATLAAVWVDGILINRPLSPVTAAAAAYNNNPDLDKPSTGATTNLLGTYSPAVSTKTWSASFNACAGNADTGSCVNTPLTKSGGNYTFYTWTDSSGKLNAGTACPNGQTCTTKTSTSKSSYNYWSVTTTTAATDNRWMCGTGSSASGGGGDMYSGTSPMDGASHTLSDGTTVTYPNGGPYYYRLKTGVTVNLSQYGLPATTTDTTALYTATNWEAIPVPASQYQNFANWYAYYRTRNQMARTSLSLVFGQLGATTESGGFGSNIRMAWQNLNTSGYKLPTTAIISELIDGATCATLAATDSSKSPSSAQSPSTTSTPPTCYRSAFFNWLFQVPASGGTPTRSAVARAGAFFQRGNGNTGATGNLTDPYWEPPVAGATTGNELYCRQNFHMLVTDGLWNGSADGPSRSTLTLPSSSLTLPDNTAYPSPTSAGVTSIFAPVNDAGDSGYASLSDIAFHYWATNLRSDLYAPTSNKIVPAYLPDLTKGVVASSTTTSSIVGTTQLNNEIYFNPKNDPATWPHMSEYLVGLGVNGQLNFSGDTDCTNAAPDTSDACSLRKGVANSSGLVGWPVPNGTGGGIAANVDDTWHAALAGRGQFFNAGNPQLLITQLTSILTNITARAAQPTVSAVNASVMTLGAVTYNTGYSSIDWSGVLQALTLNTDGSTGAVLWDAGTILTNGTTTPPTSRKILTVNMSSTGVMAAMPFESTSAFDTSEQNGLNAPASTDSTNDTLATRVNYLRGDRTEETKGVMRTRNSLLGAIIDAQPLYVSYPASGYTNNWPVGAPEAGNSAQSYDTYVSNNINRPATLYVAANDGMLHAFDASLACNPPGSGTSCASYGPGQSATAGQERWAYVPRAVYANLGNLTSKSSFTFAPTVNSTPVTRDVFFSDNKWHTLLVGGLRLGGRGVYALDISNPTTVTEAAASSTVLWEFDADQPKTTAGNPANLGYTYGQPNIGRLANGKWVVLVPGGYFPDCSQSDKPANCTTIAAASNGYSSLFVLDAQTGALIQELKTPTTITGVTSYGLTSPVLGDYNHDQIDDVAFAGDLAGNLWRFDLSDPSPGNWTVTLAFQPQTQGAQPITVMPRLFPDSSTNRFIVLFGTGKYLGAGDNTSTTLQTVYGIRDEVDSSGAPVTITRSMLTAQTLSETTITNTSDPNYGVTYRSLTSNTVPGTSGGWYFDLSTMSGTTQTDAGERVVVTPGAIFSSNTAVISTLIPSSTDPCSPAVLGAVMLINATTGGPGSAVGSVGGITYIGARVNNVRTSGTIPVTTMVGGGTGLLPGVTPTNNLNPNPGNKGPGGVTFKTTIWRRRSWSEINP